MKQEIPFKPECLSDNLISAFLSGNPDPITTKRILKHIMICPDCAANVRAWIDVEDFFDKKKGGKSLSPLAEQLLKALNAESPIDNENRVTLFFSLNKLPRVKINLDAPNYSRDIPITEPGVIEVSDASGKPLARLRLPGLRELADATRSTVQIFPLSEPQVIEVPFDDESRKIKLTVVLRKEKRQWFLSITPSGSK
jgi:hypothetical protein